MTRVLVSGAEQHVDEIAAALREQGAEVTEVTRLADLERVVATAEPFDSYVQLGVSFRVEGDTAIQRVHHFYASGVMARFSALAAVLPALRGSGRVTFVLGALPWQATYDDTEARRALTRVLANAARADAGGDLVVRMLDADAGADRIAATALGGAPATPEVHARISEMSYADWRVERMGGALVET